MTSSPLIRNLRLCLALAILLVSQLALAGQLCHDLVAVGVQGRHAVVGYSSVRASSDAHMCCDGQSMPPAESLNAVAGAPTALETSRHKLLSGGFAPVVLGATVLSNAYVSTCSAGSSRAAPAAPAVSARVLYHRFLI